MRLAAALVCVLLLAPSGAAADVPPTHVVTEEPRLLCVPPAPSTRCRELPPGHFVDGQTWTRLNAALRKSEDEETRLRAENGELRKSVSGWSPGWRTLAITLVVGAVGGGYVVHKL